jgi:hypothetical protein
MQNAACVVHRGVAIPVAGVACARFEGIIFPLDGGVCRLAKTASFCRKVANRMRILDTTETELD